MKITADRIFVCCPGQLITGGPELLHQLVDALRSYGHDAFISYYPFESSFECPLPYRKYNAPQAKPHDSVESLIFTPEVGIYLLDRFKKSQGAIWWLSIDNYLHTYHESWLRDKARLLKYILLGKWKPVSLLKKHYHFYQSAYARDFLRRAGIEPFPLTDYLNLSHLVTRQPDISCRENAIAYNPQKGVRYTRRLITANNDLNFVPIQGLTHEQVAELLSKVKIYMDFGHHPGKDRLPREAAIAGCCVVTGRRGSAAFHEDVPIDDCYKIDERQCGFETAFRKIVVQIFDNFPLHATSFVNYRDMIMKESMKFRSEVLELFGSKRPSSGTLSNENSIHNS